MKSIQTSDMETLNDIQYNFLIGSDGYVYEGRGFDFQGEVVREDIISEFYPTALYIAFIGDFKDKRPNLEAVGAFKNLFEYISADPMIVPLERLIMLDTSDTAWLDDIRDIFPTFYDRE